MRALLIATIASTILAAGAASAQNAPTYYGNLGYNNMNTDDANLGTIKGRFGAQINENFGVEAEGGIGVKDDTVSGVKLKERGDLGAYAVASYPVSGQFSLLARAGYQHIWTEAEALGVSVKDDDGSFAAGVGAQYMVDDKNGFRADYTRYTKDDGADNFAVSYVRKF